jgi:glutathione S-transferase
MSPTIALVTLLCVLLMSGCMFAVGRARARHGVNAPATTGPEDFERVYRVQMNTLEASVMFLPALWVAGGYGDAAWAAGFGTVWLLGRVWYAVAYAKDAKRRGPGFIIALLALSALLVQGGWGVARAVLAG